MKNHLHAITSISLLPFLGGLGLLGLYFYRKRRSARAIEKGGSIFLRLTTYYPFAARTEAEKKMEGGHRDRIGRPLHTLEQHLTDPVGHPYVSLAGDDAIWPYGQRLIIPELGANVIARVVDTGGHFRGPGKLIRLTGYEPIDVCVDSPRSRERFKIPRTVQATVVEGDHWSYMTMKTVKEIAFERLAQHRVVGLKG